MWEPNLSGSSCAIQTPFAGETLHVFHRQENLPKQHAGRLKATLYPDAVIGSLNEFTLNPGC
jgi:hypothetical protein